jgi:hypothetical protein
MLFSKEDKPKVNEAYQSFSTSRICSDSAGAACRAAVPVPSCYNPPVL